MIVICSGFFAPLHEGHIKYLEKSWNYLYKNGDIDPTLIVIINNDKQLKLKGSIPFATENVRHKIIESLYIVDVAVLSRDNDDSVASTLEWIVRDYNPKNKPVYFFNSGDRDRQKSNPKEHEVCERYGIEEVWLNLPKINSSSKILNDVGMEWMKRRQKNENN